MPWMVHVTFIRGFQPFVRHSSTNFEETKMVSAVRLFQVMKCPLVDLSERVPMIVFPTSSALRASRTCLLASGDNRRLLRGSSLGDVEPDEAEVSDGMSFTCNKRSFPSRSLAVSGEFLGEQLSLERSEQDAEIKSGLCGTAVADLKSTI